MSAVNPSIYYCKNDPALPYLQVILPQKNECGSKGEEKKGRLRSCRKIRSSGVVIILKLVQNAPILKYEIQPGSAFLFLIRLGSRVVYPVGT